MCVSEHRRRVGLFLEVVVVWFLASSSITHVVCGRRFEGPVDLNATPVVRWYMVVVATG